MDKKEAIARVEEMLSAGAKKQDVFAALSGNGVKDRVLAYRIAAYADPQRCAANWLHIRAVIVIACIELALGLLVAFGAGVQISPGAGLFTGAVVALLGLLFVWGFARNRANIYNGFILLSLTQLPRAFQGFSAEPGTTAIAVAISLAAVAYVWFVRNQLFPDFVFVSPRKMNGRYVFSD
ncbi:hypothetical protein [Paraburkholderia unamae]|uniref:Permease n=1 Tax=Paraburkholderia unamae TaxID=219649 RepID=A0ABX5KIV9_9BURK|nr:hypothetical protein [Paraburkholderia unamae]PVX81239.1 hypothetical protein C7402_111141 [Paraburkholderia unamae]CAG9249607.1 conserved membrane hypothetical protein [Paraburkholderia unamae]